MLTDYRVRQREYLLAISRALTSQLDLSEVLRLILQSAVEILGGRGGIIALRNEVGVFQVRATFGIPQPLLATLAPLVLAVPDTTRDGRNAIRSVDRQLRIAMGASGIGFSEAVALPMVVRDELLGLVYIFRSGEASFSSNDRQVLLSFADQAAIAVKNAQLYQEVFQEKQRLDAILEYTADGVLIMDPAFRIQVFNLALGQMTGLAPAEAIGREHDEVIRLQGLTTEMDLAKASAQGWPLAGSPPLYVEGDLIRRDNRRASVGITYAPLWSPDGRLIYVIGNVRDITRFREAEEMKSTFVSVISHELKTPVALIKGYAGTLRREDAEWDARTREESLTIIEEESDRLNDLINNLLDATRLQNNALKLEMDNVPIHRLAIKLVEQFRTQTQTHHLETDFPEDFPSVPGDKERLRQVLSNLISNAIKYSPHGGTIRVGGKITPNQIVIYVEDQGIGVAPEDQQRIFERFTRLDNAPSRRTQGAGLGLYLVRAIVQAHGGQVWVESSPNQGSIFFFSIPRD